MWPGPRCPGTLFVFKLDIKLSCETIRLEKPKECARVLGVCLQRGPQQTLALLQVLWDQSKRCPSPAELSPTCSLSPLMTREARPQATRLCSAWQRAGAAWCPASSHLHVRSRSCPVSVFPALGCGPELSHLLKSWE